MSLALPHYEIGKVYRLTSFEACYGLLTGPFFSKIFDYASSGFPGAYHLLSASLFPITLILAFFVIQWSVQGVKNPHD
jgi:hypothetical protein